MKKWIQIGITVLILIAAINDVGHYLLAKYDLRETTRQAASIAASNARRGGDKNASWLAADEYAKKNGATIYGYDQTPSQVQIWTKMEVPSLWALRYLNALFTRQPLKTPFMIDADEVAGIS